MVKVNYWIEFDTSIICYCNKSLNVSVNTPFARLVLNIILIEMTSSFGNGIVFHPKNT